jgi:hypothetical protein
VRLSSAALKSGTGHKKRIGNIKVIKKITQPKKSK